MSVYTATRLHEAVLAAGVAITGVGIPDASNKATYFVQPSNLQAAAQPTINAFDNSAAGDAAYLANAAARVVGAVRAVRKTLDQDFTAVTFADVDDLTILLAANAHYEFHAYGAFSAAQATTGLQLSITGPASPSLCRFIGTIGESVTAQRLGAGAAYDVAIAGTASAGATALPWELKGSISTGAAGGQLTVRARSEVAASAVTVLRGSILKVSAVG